MRRNLEKFSNLQVPYLIAKDVLKNLGNILVGLATFVDIKKWLENLQRNSMIKSANIP
jgi:hypothetical protein